MSQWKKPNLLSRYFTWHYLYTISCLHCQAVLLDIFSFFPVWYQKIKPTPCFSGRGGLYHVCVIHAFVRKVVSKFVVCLGYYIYIIYILYVCFSGTPFAHRWKPGSSIKSLNTCPAEKKIPSNPETPRCYKAPGRPHALLMAPAAQDLTVLAVNLA